MVPENMNVFREKKGDHRWGLMMQTWISVINRLYTLSAVSISNARCFHMYMDLEVFNFSKKITCLPFILCYELN
jgi:hypothetical protein